MRLGRFLMFPCQVFWGFCLRFHIEFIKLAAWAVLHIKISCKMITVPGTRNSPADSQKSCGEFSRRLANDRIPSHNSPQQIKSKVIRSAISFVVFLRKSNQLISFSYEKLTIYVCIFYGVLRNSLQTSLIFAFLFKEVTICMKSNYFCLFHKKKKPFVIRT